ncbi:MAG: WD40/YVTN/BNR-like repeat-containing protein, partial [Bacteroidota bacterium]
SNSVKSISTSGNYLYLATAGGGVKISTQNGASFMTRTKTHGLGDNEVNSVFSSGNYVYAATDAGVSVSNNNGTSWVNYTTEDGLGSNQIWDVYYNNGYLYAATAAGISVSSDNGASWLSYNSFNTNGGLPAGEPVAVYAFDNYLLAGYYGGTWSNNQWITGGIAISENNGTSWITYTADNGLGVPSGMYDNAVNDIFIVDGLLFVANNRAIAISAFSSVPEPSTYGLALGGLALAVVAVRRRNKVSK